MVDLDPELVAGWHLDFAWICGFLDCDTRTRANKLWKSPDGRLYVIRWRRSWWLLSKTLDEA